MAAAEPVPAACLFRLRLRERAPTAASRTNVAEETPAVSVDGRYVAYTATQGEHAQVFVRDTCEGAVSGCQPRTLIVSAAADGTPATTTAALRP